MYDTTVPGAPLSPSAGGGMPVPPERISKERWFLRAAKGILFATLFLIPIFFLPYTQDPRFAKVLLLEVAAVLAGLAWAFSVITGRRLRWVQSPLNIGFAALVAALLAGVGFSVARWASFWGNDPTGEKALTLLSLAVLSFVAAASFVRRDVSRAIAALFASVSLLGLFTLVSFGYLFASGTVPAWLNVNPAGPNASVLAAVLGFGFVVSIVFTLAHRGTSGGAMASRRLRWLAFAAAVCTGAAVLLLAFRREVVDPAGAIGLVGFRELWLALGIAVLLVLVAAFVRSRGGTEGSRERAVTDTGLAILAFLVIASGFFAFRTLPAPDPLGTQFALLFQRPLEASPAYRATGDIAQKSIAAHPAFGFGPANFAVAYNQFRDGGQLNQTVFWSLRFGHGASFIGTIPATLGIAGSLAFLVFIVSALLLLFRGLARTVVADPLRVALAGGIFFGMALWFLYPSNIVVTAMMFLALGMFAAVAAEPIAAGEAGRFPRFGTAERILSLEAGGLNFVMPLAAVFAIIAALIGLYSFTTQYFAEAYFLRAAQALAVGNIESAEIFLDRAMALNQTDDSYPQGRAQVAIPGIQRLVNQAGANPPADLADRFGRELKAGIAAGQRAAALHPRNPQHWFVLGQLYELVIPFGASGADQDADAAYARAAAEDPTNPDVPLARARVMLTVADLLTLRIGETRSGDERSRLEALRKEAFAKARKFLADGVLKLKPDYAAAHFLLAQIAIRENNLAEAIRNTENTARLAPADIGVLFQLGVLYYRAERFDDAKAAFNEAVRQNDSYANARYFLGLIWDRQGDREAALSQFQKIAALNPDNEEVKRIIANIAAGKPALFGIVPPLPAPETRKEPPVRESASGAKPLERR